MLNFYNLHDGVVGISASSSMCVKKCKENWFKIFLKTVPVTVLKIVKLENKYPQLNVPSSGQMKNL
jgi:hypothetical protein